MKSYKKAMTVVMCSITAVSMALGGCSGGVIDTSEVTADTSEAVVSVDNTVSDNSSITPVGQLKLPENGAFGTVEYQLSDDKYRTYYEIFPYSFYDSNGDGIGDLQGIIKKLDYLNDGDPNTTSDLGIEGIWLMPIMPSPSYHKYDVEDYKSVDSSYGTIEDFKELIKQAHARNINVIIDLVINHSSRTHEWFIKALEELAEGKTDGYAQYYHFKENYNEPGWRNTDVGDWWYEGEFDRSMPDLNLKNEKVRKEIEDIVKFWLDIGVDGFRLDAVLWYESTGQSDSIEDLKWLYDYAKTLKPDVYMVGECWESSVTIAEFYKSGVDSFFNFNDQGPTGKINKAVTTENAVNYVSYLEDWQKQIRLNNASAIDTPFISNHDTSRSAGFINTNTGKRMAASLYIVSPGNPFIYYGEEIGMTGSQNDPEKRTGMYWSSTDKKGYVSSVPGSNNDKVPEKSVEEQLEDNDSLLNFYKKAIALKNQNPEIARGTVSALDLGVSSTAGYISEYNDSRVLVIYNLSDKGKVVTVPETAFKISEVRGYLIAEAAEENAYSTTDIDSLLGFGNSSSEAEGMDSEKDDDMSIGVSGQTVTLPPHSTIVLK